jgi:CBS domain-containing protein
MCQFGGYVLPVVDNDSKVQGLVTIFDILQALLSDKGDFPTVGETAQSPPLA